MSEIHLKSTQSLQIGDYLYQIAELIKQQATKTVNKSTETIVKRIVVL